MSFETKPLSGGIGVEVVGLTRDDLAASENDDRLASALRHVWLDAGIVLFRGLGTSPEALLQLSRCFGELEPHPIERLRLDGYPELILLSNEHGLTGPVYEFDGVPTYGRIPWHTDLAFATTPNAGALLRMVRKTATGGQTGWIDTAMAYDHLSAATKARIENLEARYHFIGDIGEMLFNNPGGVPYGERRSEFPEFPPVAHPLVWTHPETGRKVLNVSTLNIRSIIGPGYSDSEDDAEGRALIQQLIDHTLQPRFQYIHQWENDDIMLWDNRRTMHSAQGHPLDQIRIVHRSTIKGSVKMGRIIGQGEQREAQGA